MNLDDVDKLNVPQHVAVIMDGNGRWAQQKKQNRIFGHQNALTAVRQSVEAAVAVGVKYLTLYTFSTENWNRPADEVKGLMELLVNAIQSETKTLMDNNIRLQTIGDLDRLPSRSLDKLKQCMETTANNTAMTLVLALSYSSRWEIKKALTSLCADVKNGVLDCNSIGEESIRTYLSTGNMPDPDLLIRTGGEYRISNFMLWQMAYTEFYFTDLLWPDFRREHFYEAIVDFQKRQRRFGKTGDQVKVGSVK